MPEDAKVDAAFAARVAVTEGSASARTPTDECAGGNIVDKTTDIRIVIVPARDTASPPTVCIVALLTIPPKRRPAEVAPDTESIKEYVD